jgi:methylmalonyl-CoA mutase N-terminal domain/subunit
MEQEAEEYFRQIEAQGGVVKATENGFQQREIGRAAYRYQKELESKQKCMVGVTEFVEADEEIQIPILKIDHKVEAQCRADVARVRAERDAQRAAQCIDKLRDDAVKGVNLMPTLIECAHAYVTVGEAVQAMQKVYGSYREPAVF